MLGPLLTLGHDPKDLLILKLVRDAGKFEYPERKVGIYLDFSWVLLQHGNSNFTVVQTSKEN